ncbi:efflux RND transporter periplasmic adaptor subunit [Breoghania sp.]|uniref:efflux RND transporter periplasmic adaptor subunit n=1 Tax=Breoghania sp. TaxID=2065378 RepID=UPI002AAB7117|nr:efflux RND transporter periplasmic adaptor subunit [Breoghania sp.]
MNGTRVSWLKPFCLPSLVPLVLCAGLLAACGQDEETTANDAGPRPVLTETARRAAERVDGFSGVIKARFETRLAFRSLGRIVALPVDVGDQVKAGQTLARIDAQTYEAAVRQAEAQASSARARAENASASLRRARALFKKNTISSANLDVAEQANSAASAGLTEALATLAKARNALAYATLAAPFAGVVTERPAENGQVVAAGEPVLTLARSDIREAVVDIPGELVGGLSIGSPFTVRLQIDPRIVAQGEVREIAPQSDALTRTNRVRILLKSPPDAFRLGALITANAQGGKADALTVPAAAIFTKDGASFVWVVEAGKVARRAVTTGAALGKRLVIRSGLEPGELVVIAGVRSLEDGQAVTLAEEVRP